MKRVRHPPGLFHFAQEEINELKTQIIGLQLKRRAAVAGSVGLVDTFAIHRAPSTWSDLT
jgi:hypothetical protein